MPPPALGLVLAALCAAQAGRPQAAAHPQVAELGLAIPPGLVEQALPTPPTVVELKTSYYGTVTVDHPAHLARKIHCLDCHGPGRVGPIEFTPRVAHERCRGCHLDLKRGPVECKACHLMPPGGAQQAGPTVAPVGAAAAVAAGASPTATPAPTSPPPTAAAAPGQPASVEQPRGLAVAEVRPGQDRRFEAENGLEREPRQAEGRAPPTASLSAAAPTEAVPARTGQLIHSFQLGGLAGSGAGLSARVSSRMDGVPLRISHSLDVLSGGSAGARTLLLLGVGEHLPLRLPRSLGLLVEGVVGADAVRQPEVALLAALGGRAGLEWTPPWSRGAALLFSVTGLVDLFHGGLASPAGLYATLAIGTSARGP
jgi:hypothetical protein